MLTSDFAAPASAARHMGSAARALGGSTTLPAGIVPRSLRVGAPVRVGAAANENFKGALPQAGKAVAEPLPLKPIAAAAGLAGTLGTLEFMGPAAGWGVRKTLGRLPNWLGGQYFYNAGSVPAAGVNALYQAKFRDLFSRDGWRRMAANFYNTADIYAHGGHVSMHGLDGVTGDIKGFGKQATKLHDAITQKRWFGILKPKALTDAELLQRFDAFGRAGKLSEMVSPELLKSARTALDDHQIALEVFENSKQAATHLGQRFGAPVPDLEMPAGIRQAITREVGRIKDGLGNVASAEIKQARSLLFSQALEGHHYVNAENGIATAAKGTFVKPKYEWGVFRPFSSWNPVHWFRGDVVNQAAVDAKEVTEGTKALPFWQKQLGKLADAGATPKAWEASAVEGETMLARMGSRIMNGRAMGVLLKGGLVAAVGLLGIKLTQHFAGQVAQAQEMHKDLTGKEVSAWQLLMNPSKLPPVTQHIRANLIEQAAPGAAHVVGEGLDKYAMSDGLRGFKFLPMAAGQLIGHSMSGFAPSTDFLGSYHAIKYAGGDSSVPAQAYAALMEAASPEVRRNGGKAAPLVMKMAESYAAEGATAAKVVQEIEARKPFIERAQRAQAVVLAEEAAQEKVATQDVAAQNNVAAPQEEITASQQNMDVPTMKVAAKAVPDAAMEHQGRVADMQRQVGA